MPATTDLRALYDTVLAPRLAALEAERLRVKSAFVASALLIGLPMVMAFCGGDAVLALALPERAWPFIFPVALVLLVAGVGIALTRYAFPGATALINYRARFKRDIVAEIVHAVSPRAVYSPHQSVHPAIFEQSGLFDHSGEARGDDLVRGAIGDTPFEACEIGPAASDNGQKRSSASFRGLFFHLDFNKTIHGRTIVQPQNAGLVFKSRDGLSRVPLENPKFEALFDVFSTNPVEARYILTPVLMERIVEIQEKTGRQVCLSFVDNRAFVAVHYGRPLFEPSISATTSYEALAEMADHFRLAELVVHELDLNTRIWTKDVNPNLLSQEPAQAPMAALNTGDATVEQVLREATGMDDRDTGPAPVKPHRPRADVERYSDLAIVRYRIAWWAVMCFSISMAFAAAAVLAIAFLIDPEWALREVWLPAGGAEAEGVAFAEMAPIVLGISAVVGGFVTLYWITYVRRVVIERDQIRVRRGLSPFSRSYPRSAQTRILQMDNFLYLGRADAVKLINPSLSPMLRSKEEARWVAWEMRRALNDITSSLDVPSRLTS